jgi:hypothetical protein
MTLDQLQSISLAQAYYCETCQAFINSSTQCPICAGSAHLICMAQLMGERETTVDESYSHRPALDRDDSRAETGLAHGGEEQR